MTVKISLMIEDNLYAFAYPTARTINNLATFIENNFTECLRYMFSHTVELIDVGQNTRLDKASQIKDVLTSRQHVRLKAMFRENVYGSTTFDNQCSFLGDLEPSAEAALDDRSLSSIHVVD